MWFWKKIQTVSWLIEIGLKKPIHVVALVLEDNQGNILLAKRPVGKHLAGLWEFPGGKVEPGETYRQALIREIKEELDYSPRQFEHLITVKHKYPKKTIVLHTFHCIDDTAKVFSAENQQLIWLHKSKLTSIDMPKADTPIVNILKNS
ncbi:MAG: 8-oxo-dGTP diphosphatase MutT [Proteobacteria bacterium]|nr:8-oxo-dGTP diphosphatase MutT [Pseudomonadota bacterium]